MSYSIIMTLVCLVLLALLVLVIYLDIKMRKEIKNIEKNARTILEKERKNEEKKQDINTGNHADDVHNASDILSELANKRR